MPLSEASGFPDLIHVGKPPPTPELGLWAWLSWIERGFAAGSKIVIDYTDHHLAKGENSPLGQFYVSSLFFAHMVIVPSEPMKDKLSGFLGQGKEITVIEDSCEVSPPIAQKRSDSTDGVPIGLWFGHPSNFTFLWRLIEEGSLFPRESRLALVTSHAFFQRYNIKTGRWVSAPNDLLLFGVPWSPNNLIDTGRQCQWCVIPSDPRDQQKSGASSNRLVTSLAMGLPTIASTLESYQEFLNYFTPLENASASSALLEGGYSSDLRPTAFQAQHLKRFSSEALSIRWSEALRQFA